MRRRDRELGQQVRRLVEGEVELGDVGVAGGARQHMEGVATKVSGCDVLLGRQVLKGILPRFRWRDAALRQRRFGEDVESFGDLCGHEQFEGRLVEVQGVDLQGEGLQWEQVVVDPKEEVVEA